MLRGVGRGRGYSACVESPRNLSAVESRVCARLSERREAMLTDLKRYVAIPTKTGHVPGLDEFRGLVCARMERLGANVKLVPGDPQPEWLYGGTPGGVPAVTAVCGHAAGRPGKRFLLSGHLDTVHPPEISFRELSVSTDGKTATGPGCVDMKGGLIVAMHALEALAEIGTDLAWTFVFNSDEETGSYNSERTLASESAQHDYGLVFEPAMLGGELAVERMGSGQFILEVHGRAAHVGREFFEGVSAVTALAERLVTIGRMPDPTAKRIVNIGPVEGGSATNVVPDLARAWGNVRFPTSEQADELSRMLDALATTDDALPRVVVRKSFIRPAKPLTPTTEALALAARGAAESLGQKLPFGTTGGVCDGNILQHAGLPTIDTLGVRGGGLHTLKEWVEVPSLVERSQLLAVLMLRLSETA